jgi:hypothetical protein
MSVLAGPRLRAGDGQTESYSGPEVRFWEYAAGQISSKPVSG